MALCPLGQLCKQILALDSDQGREFCLQVFWTYVEKRSSYDPGNSKVHVIAKMLISANSEYYLSNERVSFRPCIICSYVAFHEYPSSYDH